MSNSRKFRRLTDLFVVGQPIALGDGTHMWVQAMNAYQRDEAISAAQIGRSRLVMAMREAGDEKMKIEARFYEKGRDETIDELAELRVQGKVGDFIDDLRADPDWKERLDILMNTNGEDTAKPLTAEEIVLLEKVNNDFIEEMRKKEKDERDYVSQSLHKLTDEDLINEVTDDWIENRGSTLATAEYALTEIAYCTRYCNAVQTEPGAPLDHSSCDGHTERVFESREDVKAAPEQMLSVIQATLAELNVMGRDPKGSASPASSSGSSPTPSEQEESMPSTSAEIPA